MKKIISVFLAILLSVLMIPLSNTAMKASALEKPDALIWSPSYITKESLKIVDLMKTTFEKAELTCTLSYDCTLSQISQSLDLNNLSFIMVYKPYTSINSADMNILKEFNNSGRHIMFIAEHKDFVTVNANVSAAAKDLGFDISFSTNETTPSGLAVSVPINSDAPLLVNVNELSFGCAGSIIQTDNATETVVCENKVCLVGKQIDNGYISIFSDCNVFDYAGVAGYKCSTEENVATLLLNCYAIGNNSNPIHTYTSIVITPTCTKQGYTIYTCTDCGQSYKYNFINAYGHDWYAATCTDISICKTCGIDSGKPLGHKWAFSETLMKPTCKDNGTDIYKCVNCGESYTETVPVLAHNFVEEKVYASCDKDGYYYYECTMCGLSYNGDTIPATGHKFTSYYTNKAATCVAEGEQYSKCDYGCGTINYVATPKLEHQYKESITYPTCEKDGYSTFTCVMCASSFIDKKIEKFGHSFTLYIVDEGSATCYSDGTKTAICNNGCGKRNTVIDYGSKTDHDLVYFETICSPSCTDEGIEEARCINYDMCGYREEYTLDPYGHDFEVIDTTEDGNTIYRCNNCKYIYTEFEDEVEHFYPAEWTTIIEPSCQEKGVAIRICYDCDSIESKYIPKSGHIDVNGDDKCDFCNKTIVIVEPNEEKPCSCNCHAGGIKAFFFKLLNFFAKIFDKSARVCECGKSH